jgi:hypothetical protein
MSNLALWVGGGVIVALIVATFWGMWSEGSPEAPPWASGSDGDEAAGGHGGHHAGGGGGTFIGPDGGHH